MRKPVCVKQIYSQPAIPSSQNSPASRLGPVQAERNEPEGSLDGWLRCVSSRWREWQAAAALCFSFYLESSPFHAPPPPVSASWRSSRRARLAPIPSAVDHCPARMGPEYDARTAPTAFASTHLLPW